MQNITREMLLGAYLVGSCSEKPDTKWDAIKIGMELMDASSEAIPEVTIAILHQLGQRHLRPLGKPEHSPT